MVHSRGKLISYDFGVVIEECFWKFLARLGGSTIRFPSLPTYLTDYEPTFTTFPYYLCTLSVFDI